MINMSALLRALPISGLEPEWMALISGLIEAPKDQAWRFTLTLFEPPAGQRVPYIDPLAALPILLRSQGETEEVAQVRAHDLVATMKASLDAHCWVNFFNLYEPESPECISAADLVAWLRAKALAPSHLTDFLEHVIEVTVSTPMFRGPDTWNSPWSLANLPALPPPKAMIEFVPGSPWCDAEWEWKLQSNPFLRWREAIRPIAKALEQALGEPVYYFADLDNDLDDDDVHRFLVLHWCCTYQPESAYVKYLVKVCGAGDVEELKAALIDPTSYTHPFEMNNSLFGMEANFCRFDYLPPTVHQTVAVVFSTLEALRTAETLLAQQIGRHVCIIAPLALVADEWVKPATRYCRDWEIRYVYGGNLDDPIEILALVDELCVIANEQTPSRGCDLKLENSVEELLWLALDLGIKAQYRMVDGMSLWNPEVCLKQRGVPQRVALRQAQRAAFTRQLAELRIENEYGSSGLWDTDGKMLGYDRLDLPFPLVKRIAAWQRDFDDTVTPPDNGDDAWWDRHGKEKIEIAKALQAAVGSGITVSVRSGDRWLAVSEFQGRKRNGRESMPALTEDEAVFAFAKAWNRLEPDNFLAMLAPDARYASQWVFEELVGAPAIADYLRGKMRTVRAHGVNDPNSRVRVEIGRTAQGPDGRPCAFMTQGRTNAVQAAVLFEVSEGQVTRYDLCIPQILGAVRTGVFPV